jgi:hypothetical protein
MGNPTATTGTDDQKILLERLRADCDVAFRNWTAQVRVLQSVSSAEPQDLGALEQTRRWADEAAAIYREKRNLFMELLIRSQQAEQNRDLSTDNLQPAAPPKERARKVERLAHQIWEESGRPSGSAEHDWYQAEHIINTRR